MHAFILSELIASGLFNQSEVFRNVVHYIDCLVVTAGIDIPSSHKHVDVFPHIFEEFKKIKYTPSKPGNI